MNNGYSRSEQRREAARKYALQCMNARGEIECSECGGAVDEARGNRNAQELKREGIRKSSDPICNACQASWRYSHHQDPEMANAKNVIECPICGDDLEFDSGRAAQRVAGHLFTTHQRDITDAEKEAMQIVSKEHKNADGKVCAGCGHDWSEHYTASPDDRSKSGKMCEACSIAESRKIDHTYREAKNADEKLACPYPGCEKEFEDTGKLAAHLRGAHGASRQEATARAQGVANPDMFNADDKCSRCGAKVGAMGVEHGHDVYCVDCAVEKGYIDKKDVP